MDKDTILLLIDYIFYDYSYENDCSFTSCHISINNFKFEFTRYEILDDEIIRFYFNDSFIGGIFLDDIKSIAGY